MLLKIKKRKVLIACEKSGVVRDEFQKLGFDSWSCDLQSSDTIGNHIKDDVTKYLTDEWDLLIAHPPCTYLAISGAQHMYTEKDRFKNQLKAVDFFMLFIDAPIKHIAVENPIGAMSTYYEKPTQIIHPYHFGEPHSKSTCLWLKNLPLLKHTDNVKEKVQWYYYKNNPKKRISMFMANLDGKRGIARQNFRSKTFLNIAKAMANQWSKVINFRLQDDNTNA